MISVAMRPDGRPGDQKSDRGEATPEAGDRWEETANFDGRELFATVSQAEYGGGTY